ncbi:MAG: c-type cytochrome [Kofleriaceae bacterium]
MVLARVMSVALATAAVGCGGPVAGGSEDGATIFSVACATCHGDAGKPPASMVAQLRVRDLTEPGFRARVTLEGVAQQVRIGSANHLMPAFAGTLTEPQIRAVAAHVLTLAPAPAAP